MATNVILNDYAVSHTMEEMEAIGQRYVKRAEEVINETVVTLQQLDRDNAKTCSMEDRTVFMDAVSQKGMISAVGLVDAFGKRMCVVPDLDTAETNILPAARPDGPLVGIGMLDKEYRGAKSAIVSWDLGNTNRLYAIISPAAIAVDPGPEYIRSHRRAELTLGKNLKWFSVGGFTSGDANSEILATNVKSTRYPMEAKVAVARSSANQLVAPLKLIALLASAAMTVLFVAIGIWVSWRPENEANDEFNKAVRNGEFVPFYQPVMDIENGTLRGCEVLMRWQRPTGEIISPGQFMAYAEANGHIFEMTRQLMLKTAEEMGELYSQNPDLKLSINLFAGHFHDRQVVADLKKAYEKSDISFQQVVVEVTERYPLEDMDLARKIISELQALGIRVALDDVGTGHGGMAYLQKLGVDIIKIDKMFIDPLGSDENSTTIVDSMVELADNLGMGIIAEGVEEEDQIDRLLELGVTAAQGYYFAKPMNAEDYIAFAKKTEENAAADVAQADEFAYEEDMDFESEEVAA
ncbi:cyclic di-GMP phosphodiesterase YahA [Roseibium sp. TrichSKD4]|uniref:EAL domain-containing protein n=1 Tax=Roseibium sp. TrichSKD4 TaxID=744980 RepID=UPI0001E571FB|nr:EAL domain-containing protein [Roseibium sp. TrichSKD4]EFO29670.1 cyclic di-GMP phosphodiesterase YahA [Roseibium sp. TrichSKD4]